MLLRHWVSTIFAASVAVSVIVCSHASQPEFETVGQIVSKGSSAVSDSMVDADRNSDAELKGAGGELDEAIAAKSSEESHGGKPLEIDGVGSFQTLFAAIEVAGLKDTLSEGAPFTVFAPTDEAFADLPEGMLDDLLKSENKEKLVSITDIPRCFRTSDG
jgi:uncharacterized surface protein with fasciclin (FAS1) repeats